MAAPSPDPPQSPSSSLLSRPSSADSLISWPSTDSLLSWPSADSLLSALDTDLPSPALSDCRARRLAGSTNGATSSSGDAVAAPAVKKPTRKRKSRAQPKPRIKELVVDKLRFRDVVHQHTGRTTAGDSGPATCSAGYSKLGVDHQAEEILAGVLAESLRAVSTLATFLLQRRSSQEALRRTSCLQADQLVYAAGNDQIEDINKLGSELLESYLQGKL